MQPPKETDKFDGETDVGTKGFISGFFMSILRGLVSLHSVKPGLRDFLHIGALQFIRSLCF